MKTIFAKRIEEKYTKKSYMNEEPISKQKVIENLFRKIEKLKKKRRKIVIPESNDKRVLRAVEIVIKNKIADIILIGKKEKILKTAKKINIDISEAEFDDMSKKEEYTNALYTIRKNRGLTKKEAKKLIKNPIYYGTMMVKVGDADGMVAGAITSSDIVIRAALQIIKPKKPLTTISGLFIMVIPNIKYGEHFSKRSVFLFSDCAVNINPSSSQLAEIAESAADFMKIFSIEPKIAMLSYITKKSKSNVCKTKMCEAEILVKQKRKDVKIEETQLDAAIDIDVTKIKNPDSEIKGDANILIFPDITSANIGYKLVERFANAEAIGPILQGLSKPINDLSRGCSMEDIVNVITITAYQSLSQKMHKQKAF